MAVLQEKLGVLSGGTEGVSFFFLSFPFLPFLLSSRCNVNIYIYIYGGVGLEMSTSRFEGLDSEGSRAVKGMDDSWGGRANIS